MRWEDSWMTLPGQRTLLGRLQSLWFHLREVSRGQMGLFQGTHAPSWWFNTERIFSEGLQGRYLNTMGILPIGFIWRKTSILVLMLVIIEKQEMGICWQGKGIRCFYKQNIAWREDNEVRIPLESSLPLATWTIYLGCHIRQRLFRNYRKYLMFQRWGAQGLI